MLPDDLRKVYIEDLCLPTYHNFGVDWKYSIGREVRFQYDDLFGSLFINNYDKNKKKISIIYNGVEIEIKIDSFRTGQIGNIVNNIFARDQNNKITPYILDDYNKIKHYTIASEKRVQVKCPNCGNVKYIAVKDLFRNGFACPCCGDGKSYPEKIIYNVLRQLNVDFETEKIFVFEKSVRYDFYIPDLNLVIEADGAQHKDENNNWHLYNDEHKEQILSQNEISLIRIDCSMSDVEYIRRSLAQSDLSSIYNLDIVDWRKCHENACKSLVRIVAEYYNNISTNLDEISREFKIHRVTVKRYLVKANKIGLCAFSLEELRLVQYKNASEAMKKSCEKQIGIFKNGILLSTYKSIKDLCDVSLQEYGVKFNNSHISQVANHKYGRKTHYGYTFEFI